MTHADEARAILERGRGAAVPCGPVLAFSMPPAGSRLLLELSPSGATAVRGYQEVQPLRGDILQSLADGLLVDRREIEAEEHAMTRPIEESIPRLIDAHADVRDHIKPHLHAFLAAVPTEPHAEVTRLAHALADAIREQGLVGFQHHGATYHADQLRQFYGPVPAPPDGGDPAAQFRGLAHWIDGNPASTSPPALWADYGTKATLVGVIGHAPEGGYRWRAVGADFFAPLRCPMMSPDRYATEDEARHALYAFAYAAFLHNLV